MNATQERRSRLDRMRILREERLKKPARMTLCQNGWTEYAIGFDLHKKYYGMNKCSFDLAKLTKKEKLGLQSWCLELLTKMNRMESK